MIVNDVVSLREEARAKGLPEEMINKLIPLTSNRPAAVAQVAVTKDSTQAEIPKVKLVAAEIRSKLGYLNIGDPVRMTTELDRIKSKGIIKDWNSKSIITSNFAMNNLQLKTKTNIEPVNLKLDDVGYNYQNVFIIALGSASAFAVGSSFIGVYMWNIVFAIDYTHRIVFAIDYVMMCYCICMVCCIYQEVSWDLY